MIRQIKPGDVRRIADIWLREHVAHYSFVCEHLAVSPLEFWAGKLPEMIQTTLEADGYLFEVDGGVQGFMTMQPRNSCGYYIAELFVDSPWQGGGIVGGTLVRHAQSLGSYLAVSAYEKAPWAVRFYERHGFVKQSRQPRPEEGTNQHKFDLLWQKT